MGRLEKGHRNLHLSTPCLCRHRHWNSQVLVPVTQFWEGTRAVPWHWWITAGSSSSGTLQTGPGTCWLLPPLHSGWKRLRSGRKLKLIDLNEKWKHWHLLFTSHIQWMHSLSMQEGSPYLFQPFIFWFLCWDFSLNCYPRLDFKIWRTHDGIWPEQTLLSSRSHSEISQDDSSLTYKNSRKHNCLFFFFYFFFQAKQFTDRSDESPGHS